MRELTRRQARRLAVRAQRFDADRPTDLVALVDHLTLLQLDPTAAVAPSADLVAWSRLGDAYAPADLTAALDCHELFELRAFVRPAGAVALHVPEATVYTAQSQVTDWLADNDRFRRDVLARLREAGPLLSRELPDTCQRPWASTGWTHDRNVTQLLEFLSARGEVAIAGRQGRQRVWDLAERVYGSFEPLPPEVARRARDERRLRSLGLARANTTPVPGEPYAVGETGVPVRVAGTDGTWWADPAGLAELDAYAGRTALLSPFDRLVHDRERARQLFDFDYVLEMYKPAAARRWGYYALPVLHGDRLIGKLDAKADRKAGTFTVAAVHEDVPLSRAARTEVDAEIAKLASWLGLPLVRADR